jgi:hypothetical protein
MLLRFSVGVNFVYLYMAKVLVEPNNQQIKLKNLSCAPFIMLYFGFIEKIFCEL